MFQYTDRLFDVIFGYINLTAVEEEIINTPIFQRLHHINQLGMANIIFPNAVHTRFAHSLGVMFIMDRMVTHIRKNLRKEIIDIDEKEHQTLRLAALLHDIGHFPFSHIGEKATEKVAEAKAMEDEIEEIPGERDPNEKPDRNASHLSGSKLHERLSQKIVTKWEELKSIIERYKYDPEEIGRIIVGGSPRPYHTMLLHSELDADRLDYLIRDSSTLGVSYGLIELDHIVSTLDCRLLDGEAVIGVTEKGLHAVEHYVLARYFMYSQIIFYPKIYYLENLLQRVYEYMINSDDPDIRIHDEDRIETIIEENDLHKFYDFNDHFVFYRMRSLHDKLDRKGNLSWEESIINEDIKLLLSGQIPPPVLMKKVLVDQEQVGGVEINKKIEGYRGYLKEKIQKVCEEIGLPEESVFYDFTSSKPTKIRSFYGPERQPTPDEREEAIRIIYDNEIKFLVEDRSTILSQMNTKQLQFFYLFVNPILLKKKGISFEHVRGIFEEHVNLNVIF